MVGEENGSIDINGTGECSIEACRACFESFGVNWRNLQGIDVIDVMA